MITNLHFQVWCRSLGVLCLSSMCLTSAVAAETEVIGDNSFRRGFILWEPKPGKHVKYGEIRGVERNMALVWGLSQWSSRFPIQPAPQFSAGGSLVFSNAAKSITLPPREADLALSGNSAIEYAPGSRKAREPWVHLLVEQEFEKPTFLNSLSAARFHLEARLRRATNLHKGDYDPGVHAAQFQVFFTVQNRNRQSAGHGELLWFGIPTNAFQQAVFSHLVTCPLKEEHRNPYFEQMLCTLIRGFPAGCSGNPRKMRPRTLGSGSNACA